MEEIWKQKAETSRAERDRELLLRPWKPIGTPRVLNGGRDAGAKEATRAAGFEAAGEGTEPAMSAEHSPSRFALAVIVGFSVYTSGVGHVPCMSPVRFAFT
ncbi:hypothetical protein GW17_00037684 [Ensete ventricosum]|nr:hypothetical protein GW17_00037684 [Ensete ventricosum]